MLDFSTQTVFDVPNIYSHTCSTSENSFMGLGHSCSLIGHSRASWDDILMDVNCSDTPTARSCMSSSQERIPYTQAIPQVLGMPDTTIQVSLFSCFCIHQTFHIYYDFHLLEIQIAGPLEIQIMFMPPRHLSYPRARVLPSLSSHIEKQMFSQYICQLIHTNDFRCLRFSTWHNTRCRPIDSAGITEPSKCLSAKLFNIYPRKGAILAGSDADIIIFYPNATFHIGAKSHHSRSDTNVCEGRSGKFFEREFGRFGYNRYKLYRNFDMFNGKACHTVIYTKIYLPILNIHKLIRPSVFQWQYRYIHLTERNGDKLKRPVHGATKTSCYSCLQIFYFGLTNTKSFTTLLRFWLFDRYNQHSDQPSAIEIQTERRTNVEEERLTNRVPLNVLLQMKAETQKTITIFRAPKFLTGDLAIVQITKQQFYANCRNLRFIDEVKDHKPAFVIKKLGRHCRYLSLTSFQLIKISRAVGSKKAKKNLGMIRVHRVLAGIQTRHVAPACGCEKRSLEPNNSWLDLKFEYQFSVVLVFNLIGFVR
ncbi:pyrimidine 2 [Artemisia annua]|uniref:Pyrimidine 2 n=1 Tax=Artemisia annua TaxID=35608 RepID=A0A2U1MAD9_ARTAN|nr:pyrimidine 2 [Artemisia annua]